MGCTNSSPPVVATVQPSSHISDFAVVAQQVRQTWPDVKKIDRLGAKTFAYLLNKYPEFRSYYHIPEAYKSEIDLLNAAEVKEAGETFISFYSDIIENSENHFETKIHEKAVELNRQGVRTTQVKCYGESLVHVIKYEMKDDLTLDERQSWQSFSTHVSNSLAIELTKFPRKSIVFN